jgi:hypothetical protein
VTVTDSRLRGVWQQLLATSPWGAFTQSAAAVGAFTNGTSSVNPSKLTFTNAIVGYQAGVAISISGTLTVKNHLG